MSESVWLGVRALEREKKRGGIHRVRDYRWSRERRGNEEERKRDKGREKQRNRVMGRLVEKEREREIDS